MIKLSAVQQIFIKFEVNGSLLLSIMLGANGAINRLGDGGPGFSLQDLCMGTIDPPILGLFLEEIDPTLFELAGRYEMPDPKGDSCRLSIAFEGNDLDTGFEFVYGSQSHGPPEEIIALFEKAIDLTDPWYEEQLLQKRSRRN